MSGIEGSWDVGGLEMGRLVRFGGRWEGRRKEGCRDGM